MCVSRDIIKQACRHTGKMEESREGRRETEKDAKHWGWAVLLEREQHLNKTEK